MGGYRMKNRVLLIFLALVLVVSMAAFTACGGEEEPTPTTPTTPPEPEVIEFNFACPVPLTGSYGAFFESFGTDIERITNGRVKITNYFGGTLGAATDQLDMLKSGTAHIIYHTPSWSPGVFPLSGLPALPFLAATPTAMTLYGKFLQQWDKCTELDDFKVIGMTGPPSGRMWFTDKKVTSLEDIKGMKIRTSAGTYAKTVEALGASAVVTPTADPYMTLERGIAEGVTTDPGYMEMIKAWEVVKYGLNTPFYLGIHELLMSRDVWDSLPADLQVILDEYFEGFNSRWLMVAIEWETTATATLTSNGIELYDLSDAELARWKARMEPLVEEGIEEQEAEGLPGREAVEAARALTFYEK
jgi:TRAP-type C4-dicarboxylate transport system substrate-binding protein